MSLKMKLTAYPFHFFVNAPPQKKKNNKHKPNQNHKETTPSHHHPSLPPLWEFWVWYVSSYKVLASAEHSLK